MTTANKPFYVFVALSVMLHLLALTVMFVKPSKEPEIEFSELKIKLGVKKTQLASNSQPPTQPPSQKKEIIFQDGEINGNSNKKIVRQQIKEQKKSSPELVEIANNNDKKANKFVSKHDDSPPNIAKEEEQKMQRRIENVAKGMTIPEPAEEILSVQSPEPTQSEMARLGTNAGNSTEEDATDLMTYEQMLPLWLEQFKTYPEQARLINLEGEGVLKITIKRDGTVLKKEVEKSTGHPLLDRSLIDMVNKANPVIPVPPDHLPEMKALSYRIKFQFKPQ